MLLRKPRFKWKQFCWTAQPQGAFHTVPFKLTALQAVETFAWAPFTNWLPITPTYMLLWIKYLSSGGDAGLYVFKCPKLVEGMLLEHRFFMDDTNCSGVHAPSFLLPSLLLSILSPFVCVRRKKEEVEMRVIITERAGLTKSVSYLCFPLISDER